MKKTRVFSKTILIPFAVIFALCLISSIYSGFEISNTKKIAGSAEADRSAAMLSEISEHGIMSDDIETLEKNLVAYLKHSSSQYPVKECAILKQAAGGAFYFYAHSNHSFTGKQLYDPEIIVIAKESALKNSIVHSKPYHMNGSYVITGIAPVSGDNAERGFAVSTVSLEDYSPFSWGDFFSRLFCCGIFILTAAAILLRESNNSRKLIARLNLSVKKLAEESGAEKIEFESAGEELAELVASFNSMIDKWRTLYVESVRRREQALEEKRFSDAVVDNIANGIIVLDKDLRVTRANRTVEINLDVRLPAIKDKKFHEIFPGWENESSEAILRKVISSGEIYSNERVYYQPKNSSTRSVFNVSICPINDVAGDTRGVVVLFEFLTDKVLLEEHLLKSNEDLKRASYVKSEFLSMVSHELRTPLTLIKMYSSMLESLKLGPLTQQQAKAVEVMHRRCRNLHELIDDLLDLSKIESGHLEFHIQEVSLEETVKEAVESLSRRAEEQGVELGYTAQNGLSKVMGDRDKIFRVVNNLLENALKFTESGKIWVDVEKDPNNNRQALVRVSDTGCGIPEDFREKIFDKFFQVDGSDTRKHGGSGLGLSISQEIISLHHGRLWLEKSELDEGSTFCFAVPFAHPDMAQALSQNQIYTGESGIRSDIRTSSKKRAPKKDVSGNHVLLIDDDPDFLEMMTDILMDENYIVHQTTSGLEGLNMLFTEPQIDIILLDVELQNITGYDICRMIQVVDSTANIPVLMLTAHGMSDQVEKGYDAGAVGYLVKPFSLESFTEAFNSAIQNSRRNR